MEVSATQRVVTALPHRRAFPMQFVIVVGIMLLAVGFLVMTAMNGASAYYMTVGELQTQGVTEGRMVRVSGDVVPGSIVREGETVRFAMADPGGTLPVVYQGVVPDIFGENIQVVVEGSAMRDGSFQATTLLAKCPSKFEAAPGSGATA